MEEKKYNVVFTGKLAAGSTLEAAQGKLAAAFGVDPAQMAGILREGGSVVKHAVASETGEKYRALLEQCGAYSRLEEVGSAPPQAPEVPRVFTLKPASAKLQYAPLRVGRLTGGDEGIDLNRADRGAVPYDEIESFAVVRDTKSDSGQVTLLFFVRDAKRPYAVDANQIAFGDFPEVKDMTTDASFRKLLAYLIRRNPDILCDTDTADYIATGRKILVEGDLPSLATALAVAREESGPRAG